MRRSLFSSFLTREDWKVQPETAHLSFLKRKKDIALFLYQYIANKTRVHIAAVFECLKEESDKIEVGH